MANFEELKQLLAQRGGGDLGAGMRNLVSPPQPSKWDEIKNYLAMGEKTPLPQEDPAIQDLRAEEPQVIQTPQEYPTNRVEQTQETEQIPALKPYSDKEKEELDWQNSTGYKILKVLGSGASGFGGAKPSDISNAWNSTENHRLNRAREENLRSPDSQISQHFRELASMYSDPKEFTVTPAQSAKDIMEAMPWLAQYMGLDIKSDLAEAKLRGGGKGGGGKIIPLSNSEQEAVSNLRMTMKMGDALVKKFESPAYAEYTGLLNAPWNEVLKKLNVGDPKYSVLKTQLKDFVKQYMASIEGGKPSDYDAMSYEDMIGKLSEHPGSLSEKIRYFSEKAGMTLAIKLDDAERNHKDIANFRELQGQQNLSKIQPLTGSSSSSFKGTGAVKIVFPDGSSMDSPSGQVDNILKKYPGAKVGK